ncbi:MAG: hypothetical protein AB7U20_24805 [Planctomycetaceae bacterium]
MAAAGLGMSPNKALQPTPQSGAVVRQEVIAKVGNCQRTGVVLTGRTADVEVFLDAEPFVPCCDALGIVSDLAEVVDSAPNCFCTNSRCLDGC